MIRLLERTGSLRMVARTALGLSALIGVLAGSPSANAAAIVKTIPVGQYPVTVDVSPNGTRVYVVNNFDGTVSVIDTSTNTVVQTSPVAGYPDALFIAPNGTYGYINGNNAIQRFSTTTNTIVGGQVFGGGAPPEGVAFTPDGTRAYIGCNGGEVRVIDTSTDTVVATIADVHGEWLAMTPNGAFVYAPSADDNNVKVISTASNTVVASVSFPQPYNVAITPDGSRAYVTSFDENVYVIDTATNTLVGAPIHSGNGPYWIAITPDGTRAYVPNNGGGSVSIIDTSSNTVVQTMPTGSSVFAIDFTPDGAYAYMSSLTDNMVYVIATNPPITPTTSGGYQSGMTTNPDGSTTMTFKDTSAGGHVYSMTVPSGTTSVSVAMGGNYLNAAILATVSMPAGATKSISLPKGNGTQVCIIDKGGIANVNGNASCAGGDKVTYPASGCVSTSVKGDPGDGTGPNNLHTVTVCKSGNTITVSGLKHSLIAMIGDSDEDGVMDDVDHCPGTVLMSPDPQTRNNHMDDSQTLLGCTRSQILDCKSGNNNGEVKFGLTPGSQNIFSSKTSSNPKSWANQCNQLYPNP